ncbi:interferon-induced protein 44-like [Silurus meridionalis]|uniref:Interferon-induced protein 44-like n=1 Tax=Silurus meridionalis TaxID=175797 RepID=A0A8T0AXY1_SILME|nr:interferon-induced protein 44-like [Silurus meridionalis]XP_046722021.1 interferon-induced protein 44-like [Silurus meridionalis]XP_046722022.1 interferon-induced protein 44-like [Silurus meridionalis]KAF7698355.1 hypothetical protein HF521_004865 [Silurus meridionalis]
MAFWKSFQKFPQDKPNSKDDQADGVMFDQPWRNINWIKSEIVEELKEFALCNPEVKQLRFLMAGPIGGGKSSFVNSVNSAFQNRVTNIAIMSTTTNTSCTTVYKNYKIKNGTGGTLSFIFTDTMGLEDGQEHGAHPGDLNNALHGNLPECYKFNPLRCLTSQDIGYISKPSLEEKTHCLICVVSGNSISQMSNEVISKLKQVFKEATEIGIPQVVIMTTIDQVCPLVKKDLQNVYKSKKIREKMAVCSDTLSIPMTCIFPVKNYHEETETNDDIDVLLLSALKQIIHFANDFTEEL